MLKVAGRRVVIVGGGSVAVRRAESLLEAGARVTVVAPEVDEALAGLCVTIERRGYVQGDLDGAMLVVIATDDAAVNDRVAADAAEAGVLTNRTDDPDKGDLAVMAHRRCGPITLAATTDGISAAAAAKIADDAIESMDPAWPELLDAAASYREKAKRIGDPVQRRKVLLAMVDEEARRAFRASPETFRGRCERLLREAEQA